MKRKIYFIITVIIILLVVTIGVISLNIFSNKDISYDISKYSNMWQLYDVNIHSIEESMNKITEPMESWNWGKLKNFSIDDKDYESILNMLVSDIRMCYIEYTDDGSMYTNSNPIRKYRDKNKITNEELMNLQWQMSRENCSAENFASYKNLLVSNDSNRRTTILSKISEVENLRLISGTRFVDDNYSYESLLSYKVIETSLLSKLSYWLEVEYFRLNGEAQ